jgi:hypothetical protein
MGTALTGMLTRPRLMLPVHTGLGKASSSISPLALCGKQKSLRHISHMDDAIK